MDHRLLRASSVEAPQGLRDLEDPPDLYVRGVLHERPGVAIVGTRRATRYGIDLAESFGGAVARSGWSVVSGLARGVDAAAHRGCLTSGGHAVAVLGTGIDVVYPKQNARVFEEILSRGGALLSEYPPGTPPDRWRFPARNRIIAAVSVAVVVVEAARTGGALITARLGAELGRPVFVVPGDVDRQSSVGCNMLIRDGAHPVLGASDLIEELSLIIGPPESAPHIGVIPATGLSVSELAEVWSVPLSDALVRIGRMELDGEVVREGDRVMPS
jgi:DNA processing protein